MKQCLYLKLQYAKGFLVQNINVYISLSCIQIFFFSVKSFGLGNDQKIFKLEKNENKQPKKEKGN